MANSLKDKFDLLSNKLNSNQKNESLEEHLPKLQIANQKFIPLEQACKLHTWKKYIRPEDSYRSVINQNAEIQHHLNLLEHTISMLLDNSQIKTRITILTNNNHAFIQLKETIEFFKRVKVYQAQETNLEIYELRLLIKEDITHVSMLVEGLKRYSSLLYRNILNACEGHPLKIEPRLMAIEKGHVISFTIHQKEVNSELQQKFKIANYPNTVSKRKVNEV